MILQIPAICFVFPTRPQDIICAHCGESIELTEKPIAIWGMNNAPLHRECCDGYIAAEGWIPHPSGLNKYIPKQGRQR
jgi:hypothetical protein